MDVHKFKNIGKIIDFPHVNVALIRLEVSIFFIVILGHDDRIAILKIVEV